MIEIRARVSCSTPGCQSTEEYWAEISVDMVDDSDTFGTRSTPELSISIPDNWGQDKHSYTMTAYCPDCVSNMTPVMQRRLTFR